MSNDLPLAQPASRFLRPVETQGFLRKLKIKRIKNEMTMVAIKGEIYHLWWHPHNFGDNSRQSLRDLEEIISHYTMLSTKYNFESLNMEELGAVVINNT